MDGGKWFYLYYAFRIYGTHAPPYDTFLLYTFLFHKFPYLPLSSAKYKIYMHQDVFIVNRYFIYDVISIFNADKAIGVIGLVGSPQLPPIFHIFIYKYLPVFIMIPQWQHLFIIMNKPRVFLDWHYSALCDPFIHADICYGDRVYIKKCDIREMDGKFDLIRFGDSFEHVTNPSETLESVKRLLGP